VKTTRNSFLEGFTVVEIAATTKAKRSHLLVPKGSGKSNNVNKNKRELYFRVLAFNKKRVKGCEKEEKGEKPGY
jgi:hypothetical protein